LLWCTLRQPVRQVMVIGHPRNVPREMNPANLPGVEMPAMR
jgi:hypothetical protein